MVALSKSVPKTVLIFGKKIEKDSIPDWVEYVAKDADGTIVGFSMEPILDSDGVFWMMIKGDAAVLWRNEKEQPCVKHLSEFIK